MRIAFDVQVLQTRSQDRGLGRASRQFMKALMKLAPHHRYMLMGNAGLAQPDLSDFPHAPYLPLLYPPENPRAAMAIQRTALIAERIDLFHVFSPFEEQGFVNMQGGMPCRVVCTLHDLIPLLFRWQYFAASTPWNGYEDRLRSVRACDHVVAVSESARRDGLEHLGLEASCVTNVFSGVDLETFRPLDDADKGPWRERLRARFNVSGRLVLHVGGEHRKGTDDVIKAFARLDAPTRAATQLVVACKLNRHDLRLYTELATALGVEGRLVFTHFVTDEELRALYASCDVFAFPSRYEGFGLPPAEAMACGAPVIATRVSSLPEVVGDAGLLVEVGAVEQLASALQQLMGDEDLRQAYARRGLERARRLTWEAVAADTLRLYGALGPVTEPAYGFVIGQTPRRTRPRLAWFSSASGGPSAPSEALFTSLLEHFEIDLFVERDVSPAPARCRVFESQEIDRCIQARGYLTIVYQLGKAPCSGAMADALLRHGGILTFPDDARGGQHRVLLERALGIIVHSERTRREIVRQLAGVGPANLLVLETGSAAEPRRAPERAAAAYRDFIEATMALPQTRRKMLADFAGQALGDGIRGKAGALVARQLAALILRRFPEGP